MDDPRRRVPRTDHLLALPIVAVARARLAEQAIRDAVARVQERVREGRLAAEEAAAALGRELDARRPDTITPVLNATGVVVHTNLGRAPLSAAAAEALTRAAGYADIELDLETGKRGPRGAGAHRALLAACPAAEAALIVNNGAAALLLAVTALGGGREIVVSRGELIEIGAGFRLPDLMETTGSRLREVGSTNRTHPADYARVLGPETGCVVKAHTSNFRVTGFTSDVGVAALRGLLDEHAAARGVRIPLVVDLGSGLIDPDPALPHEPDITGALRAGANVVIASGDKLLGGPQAGILLGRTDAIGRLATHPLARAVRADKLALAALEATLRGPATPVATFLHADPDALGRRALAVADGLNAVVGTEARVVPHDGRVGGGGAPGRPLPGWAIELPEAYAERLRRHAVVGRVHQDRCLVDLRCVPEDQDGALLAALIAVAGER
ncbi:MAG: L-seryl-tRNA(Sec) selenium transferase [Tessaracoccus sp.]|uniref:L-seryl-tRNA(Sec) selenium transferase n=1 Tax=Tessaracoccus sp. TaxID=1971211 RepID=UPI001ECCE544|nr:L-seryl-tRNA(Sec) selenium transferase [Tessaracoccus sp.]MBK7821831.1 L-seryl-tRNA(Sec) selenium transferase [Tessaracoccus sp.]